MQTSKDITTVTDTPATDRNAAPEAPITRRYFPEWANRPVHDGTPAESERNSYSAGGYAEEFGYCWQSGLPSPASELDDPESSRQWRVFIGCLHPGYPECPRPLVRAADLSVPGGAGGSLSVQPAARSGARPPVGLQALNIIRVHRTRERRARSSALWLWRIMRIRLRGL